MLRPSQVKWQDNHLCIKSMKRDPGAEESCEELLSELMIHHTESQQESFYPFIFYLSVNKKHFLSNSIRHNSSDKEFNQKYSIHRFMKYRKMSS